jgi:hypothetical protein
MSGWKNHPVKAQPWLQETSLKKVTLRWLTIQIIAGIIAIFLIGRLIIVAHEPAPINVKTSDGAYVTLIPGTQSTAAPITEKELISYCETVIETALTRNEQIVPGKALEPYTTPGFMQELAKNFVENLDSGYFQTFTVERSRIHRGSRTFILLRMQGMLTAGTIEFYTSNELTLEVAFRRYTEERIGEAQWKALGIVAIPAIEYDPEAIEQAIRDQTNIED